MKLSLADVVAAKMELMRRGYCPLSGQEIPPKLTELFEGPARYRVAYGGRGSGKTRSFAKMTAVKAHMFASMGRRGTILCAREFQVSISKSSFVEVKTAIESTSWLAPHFEIGKEYIRHKSGLVDYVFEGLRHNTENLKGIAHILLAWVDEAEPVQEEVWAKLGPTVREPGAEIWVTYNPASERSATHQRFRVNPTERIKTVEVNWRDNPWFPAELESDRLEDKELRPDSYEHIWEGGMVQITKGAYIARDMTLARVSGRITKVPADPYMVNRLFVDIGGTGARADNFVIWAMQFVGKTINVLDHYEVQGQPISAHLKWMRDHGYDTGNSKIWLPHDGDQNDRVFDVNYRSAFEAAGYEVDVVPNQGKGAAMFRVEATRRMMSAVWFNEDTTEAGRKALSAYHAKIDEARGIDLGPEHDWASHSFDAFGMGMLVYEEPKIIKKKRGPENVSWMG